MRKALFVLLIAVFMAALAACAPKPNVTAYRVDFELNNGMVMSSVTVKEIAVEPEPPETAGSVFEGWYETPEFNSPRVEFPFYPSKNVVLYAKHIDMSVGNEELAFELLEGGRGYAVTSYNGYSGNVVIPEKMNGLPVTTVRVGFLKRSLGLRKFYFHSLESIEETFYYCYGFGEFVKYGSGGAYSVSDGVLYTADMSTLLSYPIAKKVGQELQTRFVLPENTVKIAKNALTNAIYLKELILNDGLEEIDEAFRTLSALERISASGNTHFYSDNGVLYSGDKKTLLAYPVSSPNTEYTLLDETSEVVSEAFEKSKIVSLTFNSGLKKFGLHAQMDNLSGINVPDGNSEYFDDEGVLYDKEKRLIKYPAAKDNESYTTADGSTEISDFAFYGAVKLKRLEITPSVKQIKAYVFDGKDGVGLTDLVFLGDSKIDFISGDALIGCVDSVTLTFVSRIPPGTDIDIMLPSLKKILVPSNVTGLYKSVWQSAADFIYSSDFRVEDFTVTFDTQGGSEVDSFYCSYVAVEPVSSKDGYILGGWYEKGKESVLIKFPYAVTEDATLYAFWLPADSGDRI